MGDSCMIYLVLLLFLTNTLLFLSLIYVLSQQREINYYIKNLEANIKAHQIEREKWDDFRKAFEGEAVTIIGMLEDIIGYIRKRR